MKILSIETSGPACSVAILNQIDSISVEIHSEHTIRLLQQAEYILPVIQQVLTKAKVEIKQLDAIAFGCGPGSFTGVRIATSVAQGLGYALQIPLIPISSLAALAQTAFDELQSSPMLIVVDARMNEVYWGGYKIGPGGLIIPILPDQLSKPTDVIFPFEQDWWGIGNAWDVYREKFNFLPQKIYQNLLPTAKAVAKLAVSKFNQRAWVAAEEAIPMYLRNEVAKKTL